MELVLDRLDRRPLVEQITNAIIERIERRALLPGVRLPSIRRLATTIGVSKFTVIESYDRLVAQGYLTSRPAAGFFVAGRQAAPALDLSAPDDGRSRAIDPIWIMRQALTLDDKLIKAGCGWLPGSWLDEPQLRRALRQIANQPGSQLLEYGQPLGFAPLREQLSRRLAGIAIEAAPQNILLTDSGSQSIDLLHRYLVQPGDTVLVDDPGYFNFIGNLRSHRVQAIGVPRLPDGPDLDRLAALAAEHRPKLYLTNAALHNPTGGQLAPAVAHRLLQLAETHDFLIAEDDIFLDFQERPGLRLAALDQLRRVIYLGSFTKTLSAACRCGFIVASGARIAAISDLKLASSFGNNELAAQLVHRLLVDGSYRKQVEAIRLRLRQAMAQVQRRLEACGLTPWLQPSEGMFLWMRLPEGLDSADIARAALTQGVMLAPGDAFSTSRSCGNFLRFNVAQSQSQRVTEVLRPLLSKGAMRQIHVSDRSTS
ncbi:MAG TPA: PLP-dependent aminotransferase family protein [Terriglobia bacterium]|nr:PLP-dependent aminotransferase family protein [Terriglobia bacterium]